MADELEAAIRQSQELQERLDAVLAIHARQDWLGMLCCGICGLAHVNDKGYCRTAIADGVDGEPT